MPNGFAGVWVGASLIFFAYIGFDAISTAAEECKKPVARPPDRDHRVAGHLHGDLHRGRAGAHRHGPVEQARRGGPAGGRLRLCRGGRLGQHRRHRRGRLDDGRAARLPVRPAADLLLDVEGRAPACPVFAKVHPKYKTPHVTDALDRHRRRRRSRPSRNINEIVELTNIGTLFAFVLVCAGIIILRKRDPDRPRAFRTPLVPLVPILGIASLRLPDAGASVGDVGAVRALASRRARPLPGVRAEEKQTPLRLMSAPLEGPEGSGPDQRRRIASSHSANSRNAP